MTHHDSCHGFWSSIFAILLCLQEEASVMLAIAKIHKERLGPAAEPASTLHCDHRRGQQGARPGLARCAGGAALRAQGAVHGTTGACEEPQRPAKPKSKKAPQRPSNPLRDRLSPKSAARRGRHLRQGTQPHSSVGGGCVVRQLFSL